MTKMGKLTHDEYAKTRTECDGNVSWPTIWGKGSGQASERENQNLTDKLTEQELAKWRK